MQATELIDAANREMAENIYRPIVMQSSINTMMGIVGLVQLASRHPGIGPEMRQGARAWVESVRIYCLNEGWPALAALIETGWEPVSPETTQSEGDHGKTDHA